MFIPIALSIVAAIVVHLIWLVIMLGISIRRYEQL